MMVSLSMEAYVLSGSADPFTIGGCCECITKVTHILTDGNDEMYIGGISNSNFHTEANDFQADQGVISGPMTLSSGYIESSGA